MGRSSIGRKVGHKVKHSRARSERGGLCVRPPRRSIGSSTRPRGHIDGSVGSADGACPARRDRISAGTLTHSNRFIFGPVRTVSVVCSAPANAWCDRRTVGPSPWRFCRIDGAGRWRGGGVAVGVFGLRERPVRTREDRRFRPSRSIGGERGRRGGWCVRPSRRHRKPVDLVTLTEPVGGDRGARMERDGGVTGSAPAPTTWRFGHVYGIDRTDRDTNVP